MHPAETNKFIWQPAALKRFPALVLNADFRPLSYFPLSLWPWEEAIKATYLDRVVVIATYDECVHSPSTVMKIPSVVVLKDFVKPQPKTAFTRFNLFLRDEFRCQYCGMMGEMTFDHVIPRTRGGRTTWENVVAACSPCNLSKGSKTVKQAGMNLRQKPKQPLPSQLMKAGQKFPPNFLHESWLDYLYWDAELDG